MSIAYDSENIPIKEDKFAKESEQEQENDQENHDEDDVNVEQAIPLTAQTTTKSSSNTNRFNAQFQQKTKLIRELLSERRFKINTNQTQLLIIVFMSLIAIACSLTALTTNNWMCDTNSNQTKSFGLWNTCFLSLNSQNNQSQLNQSSQELKSILCARQLSYEIKLEKAEQTRIDQVSASQALIICGTVLYLFSVIAIIFAYKYIQVKNLNSVRNALVTSMFVQIISFFMQLFGFFLFILTDRLSISVSLLFVYFALAIFATNIINFITIEYKSYKIRQVSNI